MLSGLYREILREIEARDYDVFSERDLAVDPAQARPDGAARSAGGPAVSARAVAWWCAAAASRAWRPPCEAAGRGARVTLVERRPFLGRQGLQLHRPRHRPRGRQRPARLPRLLLGLHGAAAAARHAAATRRSRRASTPPCATGPGGAGALRAAALPAPLHLGPSFAAYPCCRRASGRRALRALAALAALRPAAREALDDVSFADWLAERGPGRGRIARFWDLIVLPTCNDRSDRVSAALAAFVFHEGFLRTPTGSAIGWSRVGPHAPGRPGGPRGDRGPGRPGAHRARGRRGGRPGGVDAERRRAAGRRRRGAGPAPRAGARGGPRRAARRPRARRRRRSSTCTSGTTGR